MARDARQLQGTARPFMEGGRHHRFSFKGIFDSPSTMVQLGLVFVLAIIMEELFRRTLGSHTLDLIGVETDSVLTIERLALTGQLYTDPHTLPFVLLGYGPLFPYAAWAIHGALHLETSLADFYLAGRLIACLSMIALMIGVGVVLLRFLQVKPLRAIVTSLLVGLAMYPWGFAIRPDSMYCALAIWSLIAFHSFLATRSVARLLASTVLLICAFYAKQTAIMYQPLLFIGGALCLRTTVQRLQFLLCTVALMGISAILAPYHYWQNATTSIAHGIDFIWAVKRAYRPLLGVHGILLAAWLACFLLLWFKWRSWIVPTAIVSAYALVVGTGTGLKFGSDVNYYDEFIITAIMFVAASLPVVASAWIGPRIVALGFVSALLCSYIALLLHTQVGPSLFRPNLQVDDPNLMALQRYFANRPSSKLVADLAQNGFLVFLPTRAAFATLDVVGPAATTGHFDLGLVSKAIRSGAICYAVTRRDWATPTEQDYESRFPIWAGSTASVLRVLLPLFEQQAEFGDLILLHNPTCLASDGGN